MFTDYFGNTPRGRLLDFLGDHPTSDYSITEIASKARMGRPTVYKTLQALERVGMVQHTRNVGQSRMFKLNTEHPVVRSILQADMLTAREDDPLAVPA